MIPPPIIRFIEERANIGFAGTRDVLRQSVYSRLAGYKDLNDAERLAADPTFRLIGWPKIWDGGAALATNEVRLQRSVLAYNAGESYAAACSEKYRH